MTLSVIEADTGQRWFVFSVVTPQINATLLNNFVKGQISQSICDLVATESPLCTDLIIDKIVSSRTFSKVGQFT